MRRTGGLSSGGAPVTVPAISSSPFPSAAQALVSTEVFPNHALRNAIEDGAGWGQGVG